MEKYSKELKRIDKEWIIFIRKGLLSDFEENSKEKEKIRILIIQIFDDTSLLDSEKRKLIENCVRLLGKYTGCADDLVISRRIINELIENEIVMPDIYKVFYDKSPVNRWF